MIKLYNLLVSVNESGAMDENQIVDYFVYTFNQYHSIDLAGNLYQYSNSDGYESRISIEIGTGDSINSYILEIQS